MTPPDPPAIPPTITDEDVAAFLAALDEDAADEAVYGWAVEEMRVEDCA